MEDNPFHEVGNLFPDDATPPETVAGDTPVGEALRLMLERRYSQLPVVENGVVHGMFSLWSVARHLEQMPSVPIQDLPVSEVMDREVASVTVTESLARLLHLLAEHEGVLVSSPHGLQAIITPSDALEYFFRVAHPFVLLQEIELALRCMIKACVDDGNLTATVSAALRRYYESQGRPVPTSLDRLSMEDYRTLVTCGANWPLFEQAFGPNLDLVKGRLRLVAELRNQILHFRRDTRSLSTLDYEGLVGVRDWLLRKVRAMRSEGRA